MRRRKRKTQEGKMQRLPLGTIGPVAGFAVLATIGLIQYASPQQREIRQLKANARIVELRDQAEAKLGNQRYRSGCSMAYRDRPDARGYYHEVLPLSEGMVIKTRDGRPLSDGQLVCDHLFMTYEIVNGVTANPARANDSEAVIRRFNAFAEWHPDARRGAIIEAKKL